jgi:cobalamin biosynthetic protein CobC
MSVKRDHGGGLDAAIAQYGGIRTDWVDLSTGINPVPYPMRALEHGVWTALPDEGAFDTLYSNARRFWNVPAGANIIATSGASAIIAALPRILPTGGVSIPEPTYNEHAAAFAAAGWQTSADTQHAKVVVHPNNPDGRLWQVSDLNADYSVIDESFCDVMPDKSLIAEAAQTGRIVLKSFGKFWGLAGLRLGFAIGDPALIGALRDILGPWQVSGPALAVGAKALADTGWATETRARLETDAKRQDGLMSGKGATPVGGTTLFRLYEVDDAASWQDHLARHHIWSRSFPYNPRWLRLGLPAPDQWDRLEAAL